MVNVYQATLVVFIVEDTKTTFRKRNEYCEIATKDIRRAMEHNNHNRNESLRQRQPTSYCYSEGSLEPHGWKQRPTSFLSSPLDAHVPVALVRERSLSSSHCVLGTTEQAEDHYQMEGILSAPNELQDRSGTPVTR